jgi:hypothetical protein
VVYFDLHFDLNTPASAREPAYDDGTTSEAEMVRTFEARFARLHERFR